MGKTSSRAGLAKQCGGRAGGPRLQIFLVPPLPGTSAATGVVADIKFVIRLRDKIADFQIELTGLKTLTAADFIL